MVTASMTAATAAMAANYSRCSYKRVGDQVHYSVQLAADYLVHLHIKIHEIINFQQIRGKK